jgi:hypothetical protein
MSNRETKKITLPVTKKEVELLSYITAKENREWLKILSSLEGKKGIETMLEAQDAMFNSVIVSFDGSSDNINERLLELPKKDYMLIDKEVLSVINVEDFLEKEKN